MKFEVWYGENRIDAEFIYENTILKEHDVEYKRIYPNNTKSFTNNPDSIKKILYLDKPDIIITSGNPTRPIISIELTSAAGTGHALLQRVARVVAAAENDVPVAFLLPEKVWVTRKNNNARWDSYNPLFFKTLIQIGRFHQNPVAAFFWDAHLEKGSQSNKMLIVDDEPRFANLPNRELDEVQKLFDYINLTVRYYIENRSYREMQFEPIVSERLEFMWGKYHQKVNQNNKTMTDWSPYSKTRVISTADFTKIVKEAYPSAEFGTLLLSREDTLIYQASTVRGDPYAGVLSALDYLHCRTGPSYEDRHTNLIIEFTNASIGDMLSKASSFYCNSCPFNTEKVEDAEQATYLMLHLRDGCRYTKQKEIRVFCYFADGIIFNDGVLHRFG